MAFVALLMMVLGPVAATQNKLHDDTVVLTEHAVQSLEAHIDPDCGPVVCLTLLSLSDRIAGYWLIDLPDDEKLGAASRRTGPLWTPAPPSHVPIPVSFLT